MRSINRNDWSLCNILQVKIHYVAAGEEGKPLMLFVHGFPECSHGDSRCKNSAGTTGEKLKNNIHEINVFVRDKYVKWNTCPVQL